MSRPIETNIVFEQKDFTRVLEILEKAGFPYQAESAEVQAESQGFDLEDLREKAEYNLPCDMLQPVLSKKEKERITAEGLNNTAGDNDKFDFVTKEDLQKVFDKSTPKHISEKEFKENFTDGLDVSGNLVMVPIYILPEGSEEEHQPLKHP